MSFKSIGDLAISVLAKLDIEATEEGCAVEAHSLRPATGKSGDQLASREGTAKPVAYAQTRNGLAAQSENGKGTATEAAAKFTGEEIKLRSEAEWATISASLYGMYRCMGRETAARAPRAARPIHLCIDQVHASHPH